MKETKHILIIPSWYPQFSGDIGGSFFREQAIALRKAGYQVGVIYPQIRSLKNIKSILKKPYGLTLENDEGVNTFRWYTANYIPKSKKYNKNHWIKVALKLFDTYVKQFGKPDIIHVHSMLYAGYVAQTIKIKYGIPYVVTEHSTAFARSLIPLDEISSLKQIVSNAKVCIAVSEEFSSLLNKLFETQKWTYIPNIVSDEFISFEQILDTKEYFTFINVCFLEKKKRVDLLISSFAKAFKGNKKVRLKIGGDGILMSELKILAKELGVESQIVFLGKLSRQQVKEEMALSNAFVLSSEYETFGVVLVEALALGKPVIATKCGGPESIVIPEVGYLISKNSEKEMIDSLLKLYHNWNKFNSLQIRQYCSENFSEKAVIEKLTKIYTEPNSSNE
ncbi:MULTISPECIES: glycosyltransferase [Acinetobacter]|uniref:glycosyltransferase n=1 Tax=Acinetobacter TaxID=469 RepID=UPI0015D2E2AE|nr:MULTISPECIES: glycosyltransferase [Acinetobacter]MCO8056731.1 glycosyltransferase [Acinetobacter towneri]